MSVHHSDFSGTVTLSPATFVGVVRDVVASLERSGFTHVLLINGRYTASNFGIHADEGGGGRG